MKKAFSVLHSSLIILIMISAGLLQTSCVTRRENVLKPYDGPSAPGINAATLKGKVMTGYQGWFNCPGDGAGLNWTHWGGRKTFGPNRASIELWPDVSEYDDDELYTTAFVHADGTPAKVFSAHNRKTVLRHFKWMADYGIDGAFVQRFAVGLHNDAMRYHKDKVLSSAREGANRYGRTYTVMYDLTGMPDEDIIQVFDDWKMLCKEMHITEDPAFQHHNGKPLVAIWGVGFNELIKPRASTKVCRELIEAFKADGCSIMLGVPTGWRAQDLDASDDPELHEMLLLADVLSPWSIGRVRTLPGVEVHAKKYWAQDIVWSREHGIDYMPVVFPGFSWYNLKRGTSPMDVIPRLDGKFMWAQIVANKMAGADMLYIAMFDEVNEGTSIFKCTNNPPSNDRIKFLTLNGLPSDFYLRLAGQAGRLLRDEIPVTVKVPLNIDKP
ncbi:MAG: glycoside hydrolase family 71/99-like protein [Pontiellaceae bacterium]|nr:glycoside hydrolase family 71/99-like protein [Pontiellaceae bacterium]